MGVRIVKMESYFEFEKSGDLPEQSRQVLSLATKVIQPLIDEGLPNNLQHIIIATTCPDQLAPSLGQMIKEKFNAHFSNCHSLDLVQGCAGGVSSMILASQLAESTKSVVLVLNAEAAKKATPKSKKINKIFGNGAFACIIAYEDSSKCMIDSKSKQFKGLSELVTVKLGHDANELIKENIKSMKSDPRKHLGLSMNSALALKMFSKAENFYLEFLKNTPKPDIMILHQVNPLVMRHLRGVFSKHAVEFIDVSDKTGNCGAASVGIALNEIKDRIIGKKIFLCSFGTGGVITAGLWQN